MIQAINHPMYHYRLDMQIKNFLQKKIPLKKQGNTQFASAINGPQRTFLRNTIGASITYNSSLHLLQ